MSNYIFDKPIVVFDLETTGLNKSKDYIIQFAAIKVDANKRKIIDNGKYDESRVLLDINAISNIETTLNMIEFLYHNYKYSLPSERSDSKRKKYFKALSVDELTDEQMATGERREIAQSKLEGFILCMILSDKFTWDEDKVGKWFYQSTNDPDLVILRSWIENK